MKRALLHAAAACFPAPAFAQTVTAAGALSAAGALQLVLGLGAVLVLVAAAAWVMRRLNVAAPGGAGFLRVIGGIAVGQRERVIVVEIDDTWIVVGVSPGNINALHRMTRPASTPASADATAPLAFADRLRQIVGARAVITRQARS